MSLFKRALSSVGIGGVKIDTQLSQDTCEAGGKLNGQVVVKGGSVDYEIEFIEIALMTRYREEGVTHNLELERYRVTDQLLVPAGDEDYVDFTLHLPPDIPVSMGSTKVWLKTVADISNAADPSDEDYFKVLPHPIAGEFFSVLEGLGFVLKEAEMEPAHPEMEAHYPFAQEFEFVPKSGAFKGDIKELEVVYVGYDDYAEFFLEIDKRGWFSSSERHIRHTLDFDDIRFRGKFEEDIVGLLEEIIS